MKLQILILFLLFINQSYGQCETDFIYFNEIPESLNILSGDSCFYNQDINVINEVILLNNLDYNSPLEVGTQLWYEGRLRSWVAGYYFGGVNAQLDTLPNNFGDINDLRSLYLEWNNINTMPQSMSNLTNLQSMYISNNNLINIAENIGGLSQLYFLDLGYNQITIIPDSFVELTNLQYLWLFNNQLEILPDGFCDLNLNWSGMDPAWYPYFAIGGNRLCENIPDCVLNSSHFESSLDQFYYSFLVNMPQECMNINSSTILVQNFKIEIPYPNPFNPSISIPFFSPISQQISISILDIQGRVVENLFNQQMIEIGHHELKWDAELFPSGIYFVNYQSLNGTQIQKIILEK